MKRIPDPVDLAFRVAIWAMLSLLFIYAVGLALILLGVDWWIEFLWGSPCE